MDKLVNYIKGSYLELRETSWMTFAQAQKAAYSVALVSVLFSLLIFGMDKFFQQFIEIIFQQF